MNAALLAAIQLAAITAHHQGGLTVDLRDHQNTAPVRDTGRHSADVTDRESGKVRVLSRQCGTCIFRPAGRELFGARRVDEVIRANVDVGALLTCYSTLPYGPYPEFGPAVCAGFWTRHGMATAAGRIARFMLGIVRVAPPGSSSGTAATAGEER